mmetsp:Transcript_300/g.799  ORF Transcript_300/g.799 Transcript_300/m.799 type:complete len:229 (-) Transcript_300:80-766(-)
MRCYRQGTASRVALTSSAPLRLASPRSSRTSSKIGVVLMHQWSMTPMAAPTSALQSAKCRTPATFSFPALLAPHTMESWAPVAGTQVITTSTEVSAVCTQQLEVIPPKLGKSHRTTSMESGKTSIFRDCPCWMPVGRTLVRPPSHPHLCTTIMFKIPPPSQLAVTGPAPREALSASPCAVRSTTTVITMGAAAKRSASQRAPFRMTCSAHALMLLGRTWVATFKSFRP